MSNYLDKTANFSCTRKNFFRIFFGFQIVLYGGCDGGSCKKKSKKLIFGPFSRGVLTWGWWAMGVLQCKRLNYSLQMGQIWLIMTQDDWLWPRMTYQGSWGHQGAPGESRLPPVPKTVIKQQNSGPKPWFKVHKVCPDPKGMEFTHLWGIWGHLGALKRRYLVKTQYCQNQGFQKIFIQAFPQTTRCIFLMVSQFSTPPKIPTRCGKLPKNLIL